MTYIKSIGVLIVLGFFSVGAYVAHSNPYAEGGVITVGVLFSVLSLMWYMTFMHRHITHNWYIAKHTELDYKIKLDTHQLAMQTGQYRDFNANSTLAQLHANGVTVHYQPAPKTQVKEVEEEVKLISSPMPTAMDVLIQENVQSADDVVLCIDQTGTAIRRPYSNTLITGLSGFGKSSNIVWHVTQAVMKGALLAVIDPHARAADDSLYATIKPYEFAFCTQVGDSNTGMLRVIRYVQFELNKRIAGNQDTRPILLVVDEVTQLLAGMNSKDDDEKMVATELKALLLKTNVAARKFGIKVIAAAQIANASSLGGDSTIRETFNLREYHALRNNQSQIMGVSEHKVELKGLGIGEVMVDFASDKDVHFGRVPYMKDDDVLKVARQVQNEGLYKIETPEIEVSPFTPEQHVRALKASGQTKDNIIKEVWGATRGGSVKYKNAVKEYEDIVNETKYTDDAD